MTPLEKELAGPTLYLFRDKEEQKLSIKCDCESVIIKI